MKTVGQLLLKARQKKKLTLLEASQSTKIRPAFLKALEENQFSRLPSFVSARGFLKNYSDYLGLSSHLALAVFRRDYAPDKEGRIIPRGLVKPLNRASLSPKIISFLSLGLVFLFLLLFYLFQYFSLLKGPRLIISSPSDNLQVSSFFLRVEGEVDSDASLSINDQRVSFSDDGHFSVLVELTNGENLIIAQAINRLGRQTTVSRRVNILKDSP